MYKDNITKLSPYKSEMKTDKMKVPVVFHMEEKLMPETATLTQLESVASNDCVFHHIAAMADVHSKPGRKNATGTTVTSEKYILPQVNDSDPACGMRLVRTNLNDTNITEDELGKLFRELTKTVPTKKFIGTYLPFSVVVDICRLGIAPLIKYLGIKTKNETLNCIERGNFFSREVTAKDIFNVIPKLFLFFAQIRAGVLGAAGNHFLDLMKITEVVDEETAKKFGLERGQYVFMVHCGSGILGQYTMYMYTAKKREHLSTAILMNIGRFFWRTPFKKTVAQIAKKIRQSDFGKKEPLITFDGSAEDGQLYMAARNACSNFAHANRATITHNISETIKKVLGRDPEMDLLYDMPHILVSQEEHYGKKIWVHRNGTSRAYGKSRMENHPLFGSTGEPAFIPISMSSEAYLCVGQDDNQSSFYSSNHGAGRATEKTDTVIPQNKEELHEKLKTKGVKLYNGRSSHVIEQDASHYKRGEEVIENVTANNVGKVVVKMQPISVIMY
ncbi:MAG: RtcB family protein [Candidatus Moranbacteria bacterium]|nr:RtcB family protein [Candidatus Moranbacteria bacterium]